MIEIATVEGGFIRFFTNFDKVKQFHKEVLKAVTPPKPMTRGIDIADLRWELIREEFFEFEKALELDDIVGIADSLADLLYVVYGAADFYGIDIDEVFDEVHRSNMTKKGGPVREDGKQLKPDTFDPPDIKKIIERQKNANK